MFDYQLEKQKGESCKSKFPHFASSIDARWNAYTSFTMTEVSPIIKNYLDSCYQNTYQIQPRYILKENSMIKSIQHQYHFTIEYYGIPKNITIQMPHSIVRNGKQYQFKADSSGYVHLTKLKPDELAQNKMAEQLLQLEIEKNSIIWIGTEERDIEIGDLETVRGWESKNLPLEKRTLNSYLSLEHSIIAYIEARENGLLNSNNIINSSKQK